MRRFQDVPVRFRRSLLDSTQYLTGKEFTIYHGPVVAGKSHSACHVAYEFLTKCTTCSAIFIRAEDVLTHIHNAFKAEQGASEVMGRLEKVDLLVLDDWLLTTRQKIEPGQTRLTNLLRNRFEAQRQTVITVQSPSWPPDPKAFVDPGLIERMLDPMHSDIVLFKKRRFLHKNIGPMWKDTIVVELAPVNKLEEMETMIFGIHVTPNGMMGLTWADLTPEQQDDIAARALNHERSHPRERLAEFFDFKDRVHAEFTKKHPEFNSTPTRRPAGFEVAGKTEGSPW